MATYWLNFSNRVSYVCAWLVLWCTFFVVNQWFFNHVENDIRSQLKFNKPMRCKNAWIVKKCIRSCWVNADNLWFMTNICGMNSKKIVFFVLLTSPPSPLLLAVLFHYYCSVMHMSTLHTRKKHLLRLIMMKTISRKPMELLLNSLLLMQSHSSFKMRAFSRPTSSQTM